MFATMTDGEGRRLADNQSNWQKCLVADIKVFRATESTTKYSRLVYGVATEVWTVTAKKVVKCYRQVLEAAERIMDRLQKCETNLTKQCRALCCG